MNPWRLIKIEWRKFFPNSTFRTLVTVYAVLYLLLIYVSFTFAGSISINSYRPLQDGLAFPGSWQTVGYFGGWMNGLFLGLLGAFMMAMEIQNRTLRQNIISGWDRLDFVAAKLVFAAAVAAAATVVYLVIGAYAGFKSTPVLSLETTLPPWDAVGRFFLQAWAYQLLGMVFGFQMRQTGLAFILYLSYVLLLERLAGLFLFLFGIRGQFLQYFPNEILGGLLPWPAFRIAEHLPSPAALNHAPLSAVVFAAVVYTALFISFLIHRFCNRDL